MRHGLIKNLCMLQLVELETGNVFQTFSGVRVNADCNDMSSSLSCQRSDFPTMNESPLLQDSEPITSLALSPDGKTLYSASRSLQLKFWSVETGKSLRSLKAHKAPIADMAVDSSGGMLATASADRTARVWDTDRGFCTHSFGGHR